MTKEERWFEWEDELPATVEEFLSAIREEAERWSDANLLDLQIYEWDDRFVFGLDVCDCAKNLVLRTLRFDYGPFGLVYGEDETKQFATGLTEKQHEFGSLDHEGRSPADLGKAAATWLRTQKVRPILLDEWERADYWCRCYRLADSGRKLVCSAKGKRLRPDLGPPDRTRKVITAAKAEPGESRSEGDGAA